MPSKKNTPLRIVKNKKDEDPSDVIIRKLREPSSMPSKLKKQSAQAAFKQLRVALDQRGLNNPEMQAMCLDLTKSLYKRWTNWFVDIPTHKQIPLIVHAIAQLTNR